MGKPCDWCGTTENTKSFTPTNEEPDHIPVFCYTHFMSEECTSDEPMTLEEKQKEWDEAK